MSEMSAKRPTHCLQEMSEMSTESEVEDFLNGALVSWVSSNFKS